METFEQYRAYLFAIAYRMLGSVTEAEDMVQEAYLRYQAIPPETIQSHKAFLSTVVTRLCLDYLKSAKAQRETYLGPWLPEPLLTEQTDSPAQRVSDLESVSMAFMVLLEKLTPEERAVFLLREVFDYDYAEIARIVGKQEAACRQLLSRAKRHVAENRPRFQSTPEAHTVLLNRFMTACQAGDLNGLTQLLAEDVTSWSDGGGKVAAATRPLYGPVSVAKFFLGLVRKAPENATFEIRTLNGRDALIVRVEGVIAAAVTLETDGTRIHAIRTIANPDKLQHL